MFYVPKCLRKRRSQNHPGDQTILGLRAGASAEKRFVAAVVESKRTEDFAQEGGFPKALEMLELFGTTQASTAQLSWPTTGELRRR